MPAISPADRAQLRDILAAVDDARLSAYIATRVYRNALIVATVFLLAAAIAFPFGAARLSSGIVVIRAMSRVHPVPTHALIVGMASIEVWGILGGLIAATAGLRRLRTSRSPAGLQLAQLVLKLPAGALTALFGIVLLQSGIIPPLSAVANARLAAYAVIFGYAQEALTHFIDRRAANLLQKSEPLDGKDP
jgi:hypothetical protein